MIRVDKPWGHEEIWAKTHQYVGKILHINAGHRLSLQFHKKKEETIRVLYGTLLLETGMGADSVIQTLTSGEVFHITPGTIHRFCATDEDVTLLEVSTPELSDVVRLEDDYAR